MSSLVEDAIAHWKHHPVDAVKDWFDVALEEWQGYALIDLLGSVDPSRVAIKSAHGVGKTALESMAHWVFMMTRPECRVVATAPTQHQLKDVLWPEIAKWHGKMHERFAEMWEISDTHVRHKKHPKTWFSTARTSNKRENLQGFHNEHLCILADEASGIPPSVFEVLEGTLSEAGELGKEAKLLMVGNPTQVTGEFYNAFNKNKELYMRYTISGDRKLPVDRNGGRIFLSKRVTETYRQNMAQKYGLIGPVYDVRVRGVFPSEVDDAVIPMSWAESAQYVTIPVFDRLRDPVRLVMDVSRFGVDETVIGCFRGMICLWMKAYPKTSTNQCVDIIWDAYQNLIEQGYVVSQIIIDEPGVGGGVIDSARRRGLNVIPYHGGASPSQNSMDPDEDIRMFTNRRARDWWHLRRKMELGEVRIPEDEILVNQLASVKYKYAENDKIRVESKASMRERLGDDASPDRADCLVMGFAPYYSLIGAMPGELNHLDLSIALGDFRPTHLNDLRHFS